MYIYIRAGGTPAGIALAIACRCCCLLPTYTYNSTTTCGPRHLEETSVPHWVAPHLPTTTACCYSSCHCGIGCGSGHIQL